VVDDDDDDREGFDGQTRIDNDGEEEEEGEGDGRWTMDETRRHEGDKYTSTPERDKGRIRRANSSLGHAPLPGTKGGYNRTRCTARWPIKGLIN
jgi:hypothetical protein